MATSWGMRKALGRRYGMDPAVLMEAQRLQEEYGLMPGREARALQASQFNRSLAQQQSQYDETAEGNKQAGMVGTAANVATTGAMIRGMTMQKGEPFFGRAATNYYDKVMGNTPSVTQPVAGSTTTSPVGPAVAGGAAGGYAGAQAPVMDTLAGGGATFGNYTPGMGYSVNPALMPEAASGVGIGSAPGTAATGTAAETGMFGAAAPYAAPVAAGYFGPKLLETAMPGANENLGHNLSFGLLKGEKDASTLGRTASGAAAGAAIGSVVPGVGTVVGGVVGAVTGFISSVFGW
jgi:hypothetical protein